MFLRPDAEQPAGGLRQDTRAVAGAVVRRRAAVSQAGDRGEGHAENVRRALAARAGDEADPAGVALAPGVQQTKSPLREGSGLGGSRGS